MAGIDLLYATQRVNDVVLVGLQELASQCKLIEQFRQMRRGAVMNRIYGFPSEERQVLHTTCRDQFTENPVEPIASGQARREIARLKVFLDDLDNGTLVNAQGHPFDTMIHVGIGLAQILVRVQFMRPCALMGGRGGSSFLFPMLILMTRRPC